MKYRMRMKNIFLTMLFCLATLGIISCGEKFTVPGGSHDNTTDTPYIEETDETDNGATISDPDNTDNTETLNNDSTDTLEDQQKTEDVDNNDNDTADETPDQMDEGDDQDKTGDENPGDADNSVPGEDEQPDNGEEPDESDQMVYNCLHLNMVATKSYKPPASFDAEKTLDRIIQFAIPTEIPVTKGNAGNHLSKFYFTDPADNTEVACIYKGGANKPHPKDQVQIEKGLHYVFHECDNGMLAGEVAESNHFRIAIMNGNSKTVETEISLTLDEMPGECVE